MKTVIIITCLVFSVACFISSSLSAPGIGIGPLTIEGTIQKISWHSSEFVKGIDGKSGGLDVDHTIPARYEMTLIETIVSRDTVGYGANRHYYKDGDSIEIILDHSNDDGFIKIGSRIKIIDYIENRDEGGRWSKFKGIKIIK